MESSPPEIRHPACINTGSNGPPALGTLAGMLF